MSEAPITIQDTEFNQLRRIVHDRSGIEIRTLPRLTLETRIAHRLRELSIDSFHHYISLLTTGPYQADEFNELLTRTRHADNCFFRHRRQLDLLRDDALPLLVFRRRHARRIRAWCPACATGEEAYTLAILIHQALGRAAGDWTVDVLATDLSQRDLAIAQGAAYPPFSLPAVNVDTKRRYFTPCDGLFHVDPDVASTVRFRRHRLDDPLAARRFGRVDVILCRNALPSLDDDARRAVLATFHDQLHDDGILLLDPDQRLRDTDPPFTPLHPRVRGLFVKRTEEPTREP